MSRHRFVKNMDIGAEMAADEEEVVETMTAEEKAQMITSIPIARALLKDIRPPISDNAIADSLWHYWFDVDKAVGWLRKDWEKKGEALPEDLTPTPDQRPRSHRRPSKKARLDPASDTQPPLSALQRLSLSRNGSSHASGSSSITPSDSPGPAQTAAKPMSKLALLAQQRREAAQVKTLPQTPTLAATSSTSEASPSKPLSKLAQKMAAARAAKAASLASANTTTNEATGDGMEVEKVEEPLDTSSDLFPQRDTTLAGAASSSPFFRMLTHPILAEPTLQSSGSIHLPLVGDQDELERRVKAAFREGVESPDDVVLRKQGGRAGTARIAVGEVKTVKASAPITPKSASLPGKPRVQTTNTPSQSQLGQSKTQPNTPNKAKSKVSSGSGTPKAGPSVTAAQQDLAGLHLTETGDGNIDDDGEKYKERLGLSMKQEELVAKVRKEEAESGKQNISLIVVGHVDAGKSTLMGRLLYEIGEMSEREKTANERGSKRVGKGSFAFAWGLDALGDERDRGVTIDIATTHFTTAHRNITLLDAPGHRDFIPAMISGAAQADVALLVVDGSPGEFEAGFERGGQTREHAWLVRSLGVKEIIVGVNKMDLVSWNQDRYDDIVDALKPFLVSAGFSASKTTFMPIAAMEGVNVLENEDPTLKTWYSGPTLINALDKVEVPVRPYDSALRIPVSNVFKGQTAVASGVAVSGRLCSGVVQVGDRLRVVPGDEVGNVRTIEVDDETAQYAVAGQNVTLYLSGIDPIHLAIGSVLCPTSLPVPLVTRFTAQILVFDVTSPIITGTAVELFHHSINLPATISKLVSVSEKGKSRANPRVLQKGATAMVEITLRASSSNPSARSPVIPLEAAADNKEMGRVLIRRGGETIAAGVVEAILN